MVAVVSCVVLLLDCLIGALAGGGVIAFCWRLRRPLRWARTYDARITEDGLYGELPIYGFLRRYLLVLLFSGFIVLLASLVVVIRELPQIVACKDCGLTHALPPTLFGLFGIHMSTIAWFETTRHQHRKPYRIAELVDDVRKRLWRIAVILLIATGLSIILWVSVKS